MTTTASAQSELAAPSELRSSTVLAFLSGTVLVASLVLGGGTRSGFLSDAILQLVATPLLVAALWRLTRSGAFHRLRGALAFCAAFVLVPILQLVPLPPALWTALPGREAVAEAYALLGRELPWHPISVAPHATWLGLVSLVVPLGIFLATLQLGRRARRALSLAVLGIGVVSVFLGLLQVAQGPGSPLRFFAFTNPTEAVGFFANRNHFAALLYSLMLLAAAWTVHIGGRVTAAGAQRHDTPLILALCAGLAVTVALVAAQMMARSRAGLALAIIALLGIWALAIRDRKSGARSATGRLIAGAVGLALVLGAQFALYRVLDRFDADPLADARITFARTTIEAAKAHMPFGSGVGTFVPVYKAFESIQDARSFYANRAHNDALEVWLEAGVPALILIALFLVWLSRRNLALWRTNPPPGGEIDLLLARAAGLVLALVLAHCLVDYPLRTAAMMALFAFAAALLFDPPDEPKPPQAPRPRPDGKRNPAPKTTQRAEKLNQELPNKPATGDWPDLEWPEAWRSEPKRRAADRPPKD